MKAIRVEQFGGPEVLKLQEVAEPAPGPNQVVVNIRAIGVNPIETYLRSGSNPKLPLPYTPGTDAAGEIVALGDSVRHFKLGDRVYTSDTETGAYAEKTLCRASAVYHLPKKCTFIEGAALNIPYATAYRALFQRARGVAGETVLIHGASGGVGTAAVQLARAAGLTVLGTAGTQRGGQLVHELGAHYVLDHRAPDYLAEVMTITEGHGVDIVLEMLSNVNLDKDLTVLALGGRVIVIGSRGRIEINPRETMSRDADIRGMMLFNASEKEKSGIHAALRAGLENGTLKPVIGHEFPLAEAARAHERILQPGAHGKIVLIP
jgi:NADPH2:quinone reductase